MSTIFASIFPVFATVMLGFALRKSGVISAGHWQAVETLCFWLLLPALLMQTLMKADLTAVSLGPYTYSILATLFSMVIFALALWPLLHRAWGTSRSQYSTIFQTITRWHGFIALAIVLDLYADTGAALIALAFVILVPILQLINIFVLAAFSTGKRPSPAAISRIILQNPIIWGVIIGLVCNRSGLPLWEPLMSLVDLLGRSALAMSLLALGAGLSLQASMNPSRELLVAVSGKLLVSPAVMAFWAWWFGIRGMTLGVLLISAAVPTAMNGYILARKMGGDAELYAAVSTIQTVVSAFTLPIILWLSQWI